MKIEKNLNVNFVNNFAFKTIGDVNRHTKKSHNNKEFFKCELCSKTFSQKSDMRQHYKRFHKAKDYQCDQCKKEFESSSRLRIHVQIVHEGQKKYCCTFCEKYFSYNGLLKKHVMSFHSESL